ncbi:hypothetical protein FRB94_002670 [Tulasnella sp. JGI-2019a]|nr:hypothetical protein FRB93_002100 [Tulasnella sp. JGI-2019a]KAG9004079.1 hypothetical protein FRB94_002670 [Tulasnella sp. JGI-2019a]
MTREPNTESLQAADHSSAPNSPTGCEPEAATPSLVERAMMGLIPVVKQVDEPITKQERVDNESPGAIMLTCATQACISRPVMIVPLASNRQYPPRWLKSKRSQESGTLLKLLQMIRNLRHRLRPLTKILNQDRHPHTISRTLFDSTTLHGLGQLVSERKQRQNQTSILKQSSVLKEVR